jgi:hypothetical protein
MASLTVFMGAPICRATESVGWAKPIILIVLIFLRFFISKYEQFSKLNIF